MPASPAHADTPGVAPASTPYVPLPVPFLRAFAHDPLSIGCYAVIARCAFTAKGATPLSPADLALFSGDTRPAMRTQVARRIQSLIDNGWLTAASSPGQKMRLLPTWGRGKEGTLHAWNWEKAQLGRPRSVALVAVPQVLLDDAIGRLTPMPCRTRAVITRQLTHPALTLADIGVAALLLAGITTTPSTTLRLLAGDEARLLASLSQARILDLAAIGALLGWHDGEPVPTTLTPFGRQRQQAIKAGATTESPSRSVSESGSESLSRSRSDSPDSAAQSPITYPDKPISAINRCHMNLRDDQDQESPPNPPTIERQQSMGADSFVENTRETHAPLILDPQVRANHQALNPARTIPATEWTTLAELQAMHGAAQILLWQARACRAAAQNQPSAVVPAYYAACAAREPSTPLPSVPSTPMLPGLDPMRASLFAAMGIVAPEALRDLANVDIALIESWKQVLDDPTLRAGLVASGKLEPVGFAVSRLKAGTPPPDPQTLRRWFVARPSASVGTNDQTGGIRSVSMIPPEEWGAMSTAERNAIMAAQSQRVNWRAAL